MTSNFAKLAGGLPLRLSMSNPVGVVTRSAPTVTPMCPFVTSQTTAAALALIYLPCLAA